jgi:predicted ester cyclase
MTETERNRRVIRDLYAAADVGNLEAVLRAYSPQYLDHDASEARQDPSSHHQALRPAFTAFYRAFRDTRHTLEDMVVEGDRVAVRVTVEAVHSGDVFGIRASGKTIRNESMVIYRLEEGLIVERWCRERHSTRQLLEAAAH